jgi:hypothetical protein
VGCCRQRLNDIAWYVGSLVLRNHLNEASWKSLLKERQTLITKDVDAAEAFNQWVISHASDCKNGKVDGPLNHLKKTLPYVNILAHGLRGNPRQIKRFLNILMLRQRLADTNNLKVDADLLIKLTVLEYAWPDFFLQVVDTFDPTSGSSMLIAEVIKAKEDPAKASDSALVKSALESPGLIDFLVSKPSIDSKINLEPYLFLAQTSLGGQRSSLSPLADTAKSLAIRLSSEDRVRADAAARQVSKMDQAVVSAVVGILLPRVISESDDRVLTHIITGLDVICRAHPARFSDVINILSQTQPKPKSAGAFAVSTFLENADRAGIQVPQDVKDKFLQASPLAQALTTKPKSRMSGR